MNENEIIVSIKNGDLESFRYIIEMHQSTLYSYLFYLVKDKHLAEDLLQETFIKIHFNIHLFDSEKAKFKTWSTKIAYHIFIDFKRKNKLHIQSIDNTFNLITEDVYDDVTFYLKTLHDIDKQIILLKYIQNFSYIEISDMLNIPLNTIKTKIRRSKIHLKSELRKEQYCL